MSIALDNGRTSAAPGDSLSYILTLTNLGASDVDGLRITQSLPTGVALVKADAGGKEKNGAVTWSVNLKAAKAVTFHVTLKVSATPKDVLRLATVACANLARQTSPIVCASHSDQLPAGAAAASATAVSKSTQASAVNIATANSSAPSSSRGFVVGGAALIVVIIVLAALLVRRRRPPDAATLD